MANEAARKPSGAILRGRLAFYGERDPACVSSRRRARDAPRVKSQSWRPTPIDVGVLPLAEGSRRPRPTSAALDALRELYLASPSESQCARLLAAASRGAALRAGARRRGVAAGAGGRDAARTDKQQLSLRQLQAAAEVAARQRLLGGGGAASSAGAGDGGGGSDDLERMTAQQIVARGSAVQDESLASLQRAQAVTARGASASTPSRTCRASASGSRRRRRAIEWEAVVREGHREVNKIAQLPHRRRAAVHAPRHRPRHSVHRRLQAIPRRRRRRRRRRARPRRSAARWPTKLHTALSLYER